MTHRWIYLFLCLALTATSVNAGSYVISFLCSSETECDKIVDQIRDAIPRQLGVDNTSVEVMDFNECDQIVPVCSIHANCTNVPRSYSCECNEGFNDLNLTAPGVNCTDIDECSNSTLNDCGENSTCRNTLGSFSCQCNSGFTHLGLSGGKICSDVDECTNTTLNNCSANAFCTNLPGSFQCNCNAGFVKDNSTSNCVDVDECLKTPAMCPTNSNCSNTVGGFSCNCFAGYTQSLNASLLCSDINECANSSLNDCTGDEICLNTPGSYTCQAVTTTTTTTAATTAATITTTHEATTQTSLLETTADAILTTQQATTSQSTSAVTEQMTSQLTTEESTTSSPTEMTSWQAPTETIGSIVSSVASAGSTASTATVSTGPITASETVPTIPPAVQTTARTTTPTTTTTSQPSSPPVPSVSAEISNENIGNESQNLIDQTTQFFSERQGNFTTVEVSQIIGNVTLLIEPGPGVTVTENVARNVFRVFDTLAENGGNLDNTAKNSITSLTEVLLNNMELTGGQFEFVTPMLSVGARDFNDSLQQSVQFYLGDGFESFNSTSSIQLPSNILDGLTTNQTRISFSGFNDAQLFPSSDVTPVLNASTFDEKRSGSVINSAVMGSTVRGAIIQDLTTSVQIAVAPLVSTISPVQEANDTRVFKSVYNPRCVFYDVTMNGGQGGWSRNGCTTTVSGDGSITCSCDHLTSFAVLMSVETYVDDTVLNILTYVGCGWSIFGLMVTIMTYTLFKQFRKLKSKLILVHFCISLFGLYVCFIFGIAARFPTNQGQCVASGFFMHFFLTSVFSWMFVEVLDMYLMFVKVMNVGRHHYVRKACVFAWGIPALLSIATLGAHFVLVRGYPGDEDQRMYPTYRSTVICFLTPLASIWALIVPLGIIMIVNLVLFTIVLYHVTCKRALRAGPGAAMKVSQPRKTSLPQLRRNSMKEVTATQHMINATAILLVTGPTWVIGFLINIDPIEDGVTRRILSYVFVIFNAFQGLWIFIIFTVRPKTVRAKWRSLLCERGGLKNISRSTVSWGKQGSKRTSSSGRSSRSSKSVTFDKRRALSTSVGATARQSVDQGQSSPWVRGHTRTPTPPSSTESPTASYEYRYSRETSRQEDNDNALSDVTVADVTPHKEGNDAPVYATVIQHETGSHVGLVPSDE